MYEEKLLSELFAEFARKNPDSAPSTKWRRADLGRQLIGLVGDIPAIKLRYADAEDFHVHLKSRYEKSSVATYRSTVQAVFAWAKRRGYCLENPFVGIPKVRIDKKEIRVFSPAEVSAMLDAAPKLMVRARIMASLSAGTRFSENLNMTVADIDFDRGEIHIRAKKETQDTWRWKIKGGCDRTVPLTESLASVFSELIAELPTRQPYLMISEKRYYTIMERRRLGCLSERTRRCPDPNTRPWNKVQRKSGVTGSFHDLRKTCITRWSQMLPPQETQRLAGHANIETTLKYYAAVRDDYIAHATKCSIC